MVSTVKTCIKCKQEFPKTLEYFDRQGKYLRSYCKVCGKAIRKAWGLAHPENEKARIKVWQKANPEKLRAATRKHKALKAGNIHEDWTEQELFETYGTDCYLCDTSIDFNAPRKGIGSELSSWPDHKISTKRGGSNSLENVRPCHRTCNESKGNKTYEEYMLTANSQDIVIQKLS